GGLARRGWGEGGGGGKKQKAGREKRLGAGEHGAGARRQRPWFRKMRLGDRSAWRCSWLGVLCYMQPPCPSTYITTTKSRLLAGLSARACCMSPSSLSTLACKGEEHLRWRLLGDS